LPSVVPVTDAVTDSSFPNTDILVITHLDDPLLRADRDKMAQYKEKIDFRRHSPNPESLNMLHYCPQCRLPFLKLRRHLRAACAQAHHVRQRILNIHYRKCANVDCPSSDKLVLPLWCKLHGLCIECCIDRSGPSVSCSLHDCPVCGLQSPNTQEEVHLGIPRTPNDCGLYCLNSIIHSFNNDNSRSRRELCADTQLRTAVESRGATWSYGMAYDLEDLFFVLRTLYFFCTSPFIVHPNGSVQICVPDTTIGIIVNHSHKEHYFCFTKTGPYWTLRDSLRESIPVGRSEDFQEFFRAYHHNDASVSLIFEETDCDFCPLFNDGAYNPATDIRPCGMHFICPTCLGRSTTSDGLYQCDLCSIQKDIR